MASVVLGMTLIVNGRLALPFPLCNCNIDDYIDSHLMATVSMRKSSVHFDILKYEEKKN